MMAQGVIPGRAGPRSKGSTSPKRAGGGRLATALLPAVGFAIMLLVWQLLSYRLGRYLPPPGQVLALAFANLTESRYLEGLGMPTGGFLPHLLSTTFTVLTGLALGNVVGIGAASAAWFSDTVDAALAPLADVLGSIPILVAAPFFLIWFGPGDATKIGLVALYAAAMLYAYAGAAFRNIRRAYVEYARTLGASRARCFRRVILPAALPELFGGLRATLGAAWGLAVIAELLGSTTGSGRIIIVAWGVSDVGLMLAGLLWICGIAVGFDALLMLIRKFALKWA